MSNATHTPGPWVADKYGNVMPYPGTGHICACSLRGDHLEMLANARLIAEAPAMLAALRDAFAGKPNDDGGQCRHCGRDNAGEDQDRCAYFGPNDEDNCPYENARAILARIEGAGA